MDARKENVKDASQQVKKMIPQLLLSLSVFSFLYSYSYSPNFSADSLHFLTHALLDKNCLFLICNGLLVFLSKSSGFVPAPDPHDGLHKMIGDTLQMALQKYVLEDVAAVHDSIKEEGGRDNSTQSTGEEVSIFIAESEEEEVEDQKDDHQLHSNRFWLFHDDDDNPEVEEEEDDPEVEEEEEDGMSRDELNQKIEDFIRRMKEEILIYDDKMLVVN